MFSIRLKELRKNAGLTQIEFAEKFNVANGTVGNWETGNRQPDYDTLLKLSEFFEVSVDYLLGVDIKTVLNEKIKNLLDENCPEDYTPFANALGVPVDAVIRWRRGIASNCYEYIDKIADFFDVSIDYLLGRTDDPNHKVGEENITFDEFTYAMYNESKELTEEDKQALLGMAKLLKSKIKDKKE